MYFANKCGYINCNELSEEFNPKPPEGLETHLNFILSLNQKFNTDVLPKIEKCDILVSATVRSLLMAIRPLSWS